MVFDMMLHSKDRYIILSAVIVVLIIVIIFILFPSDSRKIIFGKPFPYIDLSPDLLTGHILFTGDTFGKTQTAGCSRLGSLSRRVRIIKQFPFNLYLDYGNITDDTSYLHSLEFPCLLDIFRYTPIHALNLGKEDYINFAQKKIVPDIPIVSANLKILAQCSFKDHLKPYIIVPFYLHSKTQNRRFTAGITGITDNQRLIISNPQYVSPFTVSDPVDSLRAIKEPLEKADITILLYNDSIHNLEPLLKKNPIHFDLVLASASTSDYINTMTIIQNTHVAFTEEEGKSLGYVRVTFDNKQFKFHYEPLIPGIGGSEDSYVSLRIKQMEHDITNQKQKNLEQRSQLINAKEKGVPNE